MPLRPLALATAVLAAVCAPSPLRADVKPNPLISDGMVLQQKQPVRVWGTADPEEKITVQFRDVTLVHTTFYPNGSWSSTTQSAEHHTAIVESVSGSTITVLEQNAGSSSTPDSVRYTVQHGTYNLSDLQCGTMWIYQPISLS